MSVNRIFCVWLVWVENKLYWLISRTYVLNLDNDQFEVRTKSKQTNKHTIPYIREQGEKLGTEYWANVSIQTQRCNWLLQLGWGIYSNIANQTVLSNATDEWMGLYIEDRFNFCSDPVALFFFFCYIPRLSNIPIFQFPFTKDLKIFI